MGIVRVLHRALKTDQGLRQMIQNLPIVELGQPIQTAKYEPNAISLLEDFPWVKRGTLVQRRLERKKRQFSVRNLTGVWAGKTPGDMDVETFLDYGRALKSASEYKLPNRIGYETEEDFRTNCNYLCEKLGWIAGNEEKVPVVYHRVWDDTYYLVNSDGGNHFAAVYRQCIEQNRDFAFECRIEHQTLDVEKCRKAVEENGLLILPTVYAEPLSHLLVEFGLKMRPYCWEFQTGKSLLHIGCNFPEAQRLYHSLVEVLPPKSYFNLGEYLFELL